LKFKDVPDEELAGLIGRNEEESDHAFREIYQRYEARIYRFVLNLVRDRQDALDIFQQVFINLHRNFSRFNPRFPFSSWLYRIATNCVNNHKRGSARARNAVHNLGYLKGPAHAPDPSDTVFQDHVLDRLNQQISVLDDNLKIPLVLNALENISIAEIAAICRITERAVRKRIEKAKSLLKTRMEGYTYEPQN
jgi:RNA polymerase sigma factor (sigma-70 family)